MSEDGSGLPSHGLGSVHSHVRLFEFSLSAVFIASLRRSPSILTPTSKPVVRCQSGRRRCAHALTSVRRSNCTCRFPAYSFHENAPMRGRGGREGISVKRLTKPNSS